MKKIILILLLSLFITGCVDLSLEEVWFIDTVAVSPDGKIAICLDKEGGFFWIGDDAEVYITDFQGSSFARVTEDQRFNSSVAWSDDSSSLLYTEQAEDVWMLNLYSVDECLNVNLLQEMYHIALPTFSYDTESIAYMVFPDEDVPFGNLNVYERETSSIYTLIDSAYYDYRWIPGAKKIVVVNVVEEFEGTFQGRLIIKDIQGFGEEIIFNGHFSMGRNAVDVTGDGKTVIFSASNDKSNEAGDIYLYDIEYKTLAKWSGPEGYEFRLPTSGLGGYILAQVKGQEDEWAGQLYLVSLDKKIIEVPGWPVWIERPFVICLDLYEGAVLVVNLDTSEVINLNDRFLEFYESR